MDEYGSDDDDGFDENEFLAELFKKKILRHSKGRGRKRIEAPHLVEVLLFKKDRFEWILKREKENFIQRDLLLN